MDLIRILWHALSGYLMLTLTVGVGLMIFFTGMVLFFDTWWVGLLVMMAGLIFAAAGAKLGLKMGAGR